MSPTERFEHPYFENRSHATGFDIHPLISFEFQRKETEVVSEEQDGDRFTKDVRIVVQWPVKLTTTEFVDVYGDWVRSQNYFERVFNEADFSDEREAEIREQGVFNTIAEQTVEAFVNGDTGSNVVDYESLVDQSIRDMKAEIQTLEEAVDWGQLYNAELLGPNRVTAREWIHQQRIESYPIRYDSVPFSHLRDQDFYPERVEHLALDAFMPPPSIAWWKGLHTLQRFLPNIEERMPDDKESQREFQDELDEEYAHITLIEEFKQKYEYADDSYTLNHPTTEFTDSETELRFDRLRFFFEQTIPDEFLEHAVEEYDVSSKEAVIEYAIGSLEETVATELDKFEGDDTSTNALPTTVERRSELEHR